MRALKFIPSILMIAGGCVVLVSHLRTASADPLELLPSASIIAGAVVILAVRLLELR